MGFEQQPSLQEASCGVWELGPRVYRAFVRVEGSGFMGSRASRG